MKMCHQHLIDIITLNPLVELGSCISRHTAEQKKDESIFLDTATLIAYCFGVQKYIIWRESKTTV